MAATSTTDDILAATGGALVQRGSGDSFCGVSTDSRTTQTGQLFIPLSGERHDGHVFIPKALNRGARGVLVEQKCLASHAPSIPSEVTVIAVNDTLTALGDLAHAW